MHKKTITFTMFIMALGMALTGCSKYQVPKPNLSPEWKAEYETTIQEGKERIKSEELSDVDRAALLQDMGIAYDGIGNYAKAIEAYEQVLEIQPTDFISLNNLVAIYEELDEYEKALPYARTLYINYPSNPEVVRDAIRVHLELKDPTNAQLILNDYAKNNQNDETKYFISEQYEYIGRVAKSMEEDAAN